MIPEREPDALAERQKTIYGRPPRQAAYDGGFASKTNLRDLKASGVQDVMFSKKRGLKVVDMVKSSYVYKKLRAFRAGIEVAIEVHAHEFRVGSDLLQRHSEVSDKIGCRTDLHCASPNRRRAFPASTLRLASSESSDSRI